MWCGFWYWGNPTPDELRLALREITRSEQPSFDPRRLWSTSGAAPIGAGIDAKVVWIRESGEGLELWRGAYDGPDPQTRATTSDCPRSTGDGWLVHRVEKQDGRIAIHVRKTGAAHSPRLVKHHMTVPPTVR